MGSDVADVMSYVRGMPMICGLAADLGDEALTGRVLATVAGQYAARQRPDGVWVHAAAWLVTAQRGTEHILLGLIREGEGVAAQALLRLGADLDGTRQQVIELLRGYQGQDETAAARARRRLGGVPRRERRLLPELLGRFDSLESRLSALEQRVGTGPDLRDLDEKVSRQEEWATPHRDLPSLSDEVERLRGLLRQHGIEPHDGAA